MAPPNFKAAKRCIFCGKREVTKEHFYSDWMKKLLPPEGGYRSLAIERHPSRDNAVIHDADRPGRITSLKFRVVCGTCNNGWMSAAEEAARPSVEALLAGEPVSLSPKAQRVLAEWIVLKCIVLEHAHRGIAVVPESEREVFAETREIPSYFRIYLISHSSNSSSGIKRYTHSAMPTGHSEFVPPLDGMNRNIQRISFLLGKTYVYVNAARVEGFDFEDRILIPSVHDRLRLWPLQSEQFNLPTSPLFSNAELVRLDGTWERFMNHPKVLWLTEEPSSFSRSAAPQPK